MREKTIYDVTKYVKQVAQKRNWILHPNDDGTLDMLVEGLRDYFNRVGYFNCPCRDSFEDMKSDRDIICPCDYAQLDIDDFGRCYCALYFDPNYAFDSEIEMIPERRPEEKW